MSRAMHRAIEINISLDNAAFADDYNGEMSRILRDLATRFERGHSTEGSKIRDINGNQVGSIRWIKRPAKQYTPY